MHAELLKHLQSLPPEIYNVDEGPAGRPGFFHYTTYSGLLGILNTEKLWATNIDYLNDYTEFVNALDIAKSQIMLRINSKSCSRQTTLLEDLMQGVDSIRSLNIFVASFAEQGDLLSLWRSYAGGSGVSIAFRYDELREIASLHQFHVVKCIYDSNIKHKYINYLIDDAENFLDFRMFSDDGGDSLALLQFFM